jgi:hypothetical protein
MRKMYYFCYDTNIINKMPVSCICYQQISKCSDLLGKCNKTRKNGLFRGRKCDDLEGKCELLTGKCGYFLTNLR